MLQNHGCLRSIEDSTNYIFQPVKLEAQGYFGECSVIFITRRCKILGLSHDNQRALSLVKQRISMALQIINAVCVQGTVSDSGAFVNKQYK